MNILVEGVVNRKKGLLRKTKIAFRIMQDNQQTLQFQDVDIIKKE